MAKRKSGDRLAQRTERQIKEWKRQREVTVLRKVVGALVAKLGGNVTVGRDDLAGPNEVVKMIADKETNEMRIWIEGRSKLVSPDGAPL